MTNTGRVDLFVVEDNEFMRSAVCMSLEKIETFQVVGFAENGETAAERILKTRPDVALIDLGLPGVNGIEVTRQIKNQLAGLKVIILTSSDTDNDIVDALDAGADGYVLKGTFGDRLEMAIKSVKNGAVWLDPEIARRLLSMARGSRTNEGLQPSLGELSKEEASLLGTVAQSECANEACLVDPDFLRKLHARFANEN